MEQDPAAPCPASPPSSNPFIMSPRLGPDHHDRTADDEEANKDECADDERGDQIAFAPGEEPRSQGSRVHDVRCVWNMSGCRVEKCKACCPTLVPSLNERVGLRDCRMIIRYGGQLDKDVVE
jgi:hypothetical protein